MEKFYVKKEPGDRFHPYTITNLEAMMNAAQDLSSNGFKLWMAFSTYRSDRMNIYRAIEIHESFGFKTIETYSDAMKELISKGYLVETESTKKDLIFHFCEKCIKDFPVIDSETGEVIEEEEVAI